MTSIHVWRAREKAEKLGGYAGDPDAADLWEMSKRELIEIALRLGELCADADEPKISDAIARVREEHRALRQNGII